MSKKDAKVIIIGSGPVGLGAGYRLKELGYGNWKIYEKENHVGGLTSSFVDGKGFTWDIGGHVIFSHYKYFDEYIKKVLGRDFTEHVREAWIWTADRFIPYPFQNNIRYLPEEILTECLSGMIHSYNKFKSSKIAKNFLELCRQFFGEGVTKYFMKPYNFKVWAYPLDLMGIRWIGERVSLVDVDRVFENILKQKDDTSWGPNFTFKFPLRGGIGEIASRVAKILGKERIFFKKELEAINTRKKELLFKDGTRETYDFLISSMPIDQLVARSDLPIGLKVLAKRLIHSGVIIVGVGLKGKVPEKLATKCWIYFPESNCPFYRVTVFSNYSPYNAPPGCWSLMAEVSYSPYKKINKENIVEESIQGMINTMLIGARNQVISTWSFDASYGYPTPSLERDAILRQVQAALLKRNIFSRGRFGAWKYEISNTDHATMQGVEAVDFILNNKKEKTWSL